MTITFPRLRGTGTRRAVDKVAELREENRSLLTAYHRAGDHVALLEHDLQQARDLAGREREQRILAEKHIQQQAGHIRRLEQAVAELERRLEVGVMAEAAASKTQELDVRDLRERMSSGLVVSLANSPQASTDPAHVPSWAKREPAA